MHGSAGTFDINPPATRTGGSNAAHRGRQFLPDRLQLREKYNCCQHLDSSATQGTAAVGPAIIKPHSNQVTVNLTGVTNAQHVIIKLNGVQDNGGAVLNNVLARMEGSAVTLPPIDPSIPPRLARPNPNLAISSAVPTSARTLPPTATSTVPISHS